MALYVLTYDERATHHDYKPLYEQLDKWGAAHLQNSVWLIDRRATAKELREGMRKHMHDDDTICVIQVFPNSDWATRKARQTGTDWLTRHLN